MDGCLRVCVCVCICYWPCVRLWLFIRLFDVWIMIHAANASTMPFLTYSFTQHNVRANGWRSFKMLRYVMTLCVKNHQTHKLQFKMHIGQSVCWFAFGSQSLFLSLAFCFLFIWQSTNVPCIHVIFENRAEPKTGQVMAMQCRARRVGTRQAIQALAICLWPYFISSCTILAFLCINIARTHLHLVFDCVGFVRSSI